MEKLRLILDCRIDEVTIIGQFVIDSYKRDLADFQAYKPAKYAPDYLTALVAKKDAVDALVNPVVLTGQLKLITLTLSNNVEGLRGTMDLLEGYVADASPLTVGVKDFGISPVRKKVNSGDLEGLDGVLKTLITNAGDNLPALKLVGYTDDMYAALKATKQSIFDDNAAQKKKMDEISKLSADNIGVINDFLKDIKGIMDDGKRLYKTKDAVKLKDYTFADIMKRLRHDELHTLIAGTVYASGNDLASKVKVVARPSVSGKRGKTVYTNAKGQYEIVGLKPQNYTITFIFPGGASYVVQADAITNETVTQDFRQP